MLLRQLLEILDWIRWIVAVHDYVMGVSQMVNLQMIIQKKKSFEQAHWLKDQSIETYSFCVQHFLLLL